MAVDHHIKPYDEATKTKLNIYSQYLEAWLQVFLHTQYYRDQPIKFFDFFSGPGRDADGTDGSPLILMEELKKNRGLIYRGGRKIEVLFNERSKKKLKELQELCEDNNYPWTPQYESLDFQESFQKHEGEIGNSPTLVFMDQCGVKHITQEVFQTLTRKRQTDLIFFFASDHKYRFRDLLAPEIKISPETPHHLVHREVATQYRTWAPDGYHVGHFSIMKKDTGNIYGLVFGTNHWLGMYRFLEVAWKEDSETGEADFDIEADHDQGDLFAGGFKMRKLEVFESKLYELVSRKDLETDGEVSMHCLKNGIYPPRVCKSLYPRLKKDKIISHCRGEGPRTTDKAIKEPRKFQFT